MIAAIVKLYRAFIARLADGRAGGRADGGSCATATGINVTAPRKREEKGERSRRNNLRRRSRLVGEILTRHPRLVGGFITVSTNPRRGSRAAENRFRRFAPQESSPSSPSPRGAVFRARRRRRRRETTISGRRRLARDYGASFKFLTTLTTASPSSAPYLYSGARAQIGTTNQKKLRRKALSRLLRRHRVKTRALLLMTPLVSRHGCDASCLEISRPHLLVIIPPLPPMSFPAPRRNAAQGVVMKTHTRARTYRTSHRCTSVVS